MPQEKAHTHSVLHVILEDLWIIFCQDLDLSQVFVPGTLTETRIKF